MSEEDGAPPPQGPSPPTADETSIPPTEERAAKRLKMDVAADSERVDSTVISASTEVAKVDEGQKSRETKGRDNRQSGLAPIKKE